MSNGFTREELKILLPQLAASLRDLLKVTPEKFNLVRLAAPSRSSSDEKLFFFSFALLQCGTNESKIDVRQLIIDVGSSDQPRAESD